MHHEDDNDVQYKVQLSTWKKIIGIVFQSKKRIFLLIFFSSFVAMLDALDSTD